MTDSLMPLWAGRYLKIKYLEGGLDRQGIDDWGMVRLVVSEQYNIALWAMPKSSGEHRRNTLLEHFPAVVDGIRTGDIVYLHRHKLFGLVVAPNRILTALPKQGGRIYWYDNTSEKTVIRVRR